VRVSAKADYAIRALVELAAVEGGGPMKGEAIAAAQMIPMKYCENILAELRAAGVVASRRGADGGYWLARPASEVPLAEVIRIVEGPLAEVRGVQPHQAVFPGAAAPMRDVWVAVRASLRRVLDEVTIADVASGNLPAVVADLTVDPDAWANRTPPDQRHA
jgi:Rrf2 family protein